MLKVTITKGLPASGKSTWAKAQVDASNGGTIIVCKDDLRLMLHNNQFSRGREKVVIQVRDAIITTALLQGKSVIVADTNLDPKHEENIRALVNQVKPGTKIEIEDFTHVSLEDCIRRDSKRERSIGRGPILDMYNRYLKPDPKEFHVVQNKSLPKAIVVDMDGTAAIMDGRGPYEETRVEEDLVNEHVKDVILRYDKDHEIIFLSGRTDSCKQATKNWLNKHGIPWTHLHMRVTGDNRSDDIIKEEIFREHVLPKYNTCLVLDDRLKVCRMWHKLGLPLMRVGDPEANF